MTKHEVAIKAGKLLKRSGDFLNQNSPVIFAGIAIAGVVATGVIAAKATLRARDIIDEATYNDPDTGEEVKPDVRETVALTWKCYIPVVLMAGLTIGAIVTSQQIQNKRNALLAGLYSTSQKALEDYQQKTEELVGKNKSEKIKDELAGETLTKHPVDQGKIIDTGLGRSLCYDPLIDRYFWSDYNKVEAAINKFNHQLTLEYRLPLNELYSFMGLDSCELGETVGWTSDNLIEYSPRSRLASDGTPCLVIGFANPPTTSFRTW